jgi:hypothetical protein
MTFTPSDTLLKRLSSAWSVARGGMIEPPTSLQSDHINRAPKRRQRAKPLRPAFARSWVLISAIKAEDQRVQDRDRL